MARRYLPTSLKKHVPLVLAIAMTASFFVLALNRLDLADPGFLTSLDLRWIDAKFRLRGYQIPGNEVVVIGIDDKTLARLGSIRTLSHDNLAKLVDKLAGAGPKVIGFDTFYPDRDTSGPDNDPQFAAAIERAGNVVLGMVLQLESTTGERKTAAAMDPDLQNIVIEKQVFPAERRAGGPRQISSLIQGKDLTMNLPILTKAAASFGFVNFHSDAEGRLRYQPQFIEYGGKLYPSLDLQILRRYLDAPSPIVDFDRDRVAQVQIGQNFIPTDEFGRFQVNYDGPREIHQAVSMIDVMDGRVGREILKDKIVLIGASAVGIGDIVATPFDSVLPGVFLHANVIDNILHQRYLFRNALTKVIDLTIILVFGFVLGLYLPRLNASRSILYSSLLLAAYTAFNVWAFLNLHWILSYVYPGLALVFTSGSIVSYMYLTEEREKKRTRATFQYYLDPHVVEQVMNQPEMLKLGGDKRELTVLFSDIRGFTSFSEKMAPSEVVQFLNQYFDKMTSIIFEHKGTLDKLIGDAVMSFWGHPIQTRDHALLATVTALDMIRAVEELRPAFALPGGASLEIGIGINTGPMVVGNMGSLSRFSYTVMGDNVNLGSRLESLNKYYGTRILISDATYRAIKGRVFCRELDTILVKGKSQAVTVYEPLGVCRPAEERRREARRGGMTLRKRIIRSYVMARFGDRRQAERRIAPDRLAVQPQQEKIASMYEHALSVYRSGDLASADVAFDRVLAVSPKDVPSKVMKSRISHYRAEYGRAGANFDPVYKFDEK
ncbi:MAG TPA: adenylate/guanylate cyclase domain-containing protein [Terriglobia bacterium]|nr:adenylate/guanylate cyclase domain-containing protein [Terriglobia bacterium]